MRATMCKFALCMMVFAALCCTSSCSNDPSAWYPSGTASVVSSYETSAGGGKVCRITLKIMNTGRSTITSYTISLSAKTNGRTYYETLSKSFAILPGKSAYVNVEIAYDAETEALAADGLSVLDEYYQ